MSSFRIENPRARCLRAVGLTTAVAAAGLVLAGNISAANAIDLDFTLAGGASYKSAKGTPVPASGQEVGLWSNKSTVSKTFTATTASEVDVSARGQFCQGWPTITVAVDGKTVGTASVDVPKQYETYTFASGKVAAGAHTVTVGFTNDKYLPGECDRNAIIGDLSLSPVAAPVATTPAPVATTPAPVATTMPAPVVTTTPAPVVTTTPAPVVTTTPTPVGGGDPSYGVPADVSLKRFDGNYTVTTDGAVIDGLDIYGTLTVRANNVTVRNTRVRGMNIDAISAANIAKGVNQRFQLVTMTGSGNVIEDSTLRADYPNADWNGLTGYGFTATRVDVSNVVDTVMTYGDNVTIQDSYIHGNTQWAQDYTWGLGGTPSHSDGWQIEGGSNLVARNNVIDNPQWTGIILTQNSAKSDNITITGNKISGGKCNVNIAEKSRGPITGLRITDNVFGAVNTSAASGGQASPGCHVVATPTSSPERTDIGNALTGNTSTDGYPVVVKRGA